MTEIHMNLTNLYHPNTVTMLDKSAWTALKGEQVWELNSVSTVALAPVLYEEIRAELAPRRKRKEDPIKRLASGASKGSIYRTYALPTAWQLVESELTEAEVQRFHGIPVDMPYIFDSESGGIILDQPNEIYDFQRWSSQRRARTEEVEAAKSWRTYLEGYRQGSYTKSGEQDEDIESIKRVYNDTIRQSSNALANELLSNLVYGGLVMRPLYCPR